MTRLLLDRRFEADRSSTTDVYVTQLCARFFFFLSILSCSPSIESKPSIILSWITKRKRDLSSIACLRGRTFTVAREYRGILSVVDNVRHRSHLRRAYISLEGKQENVITYVFAISFDRDLKWKFASYRRVRYEGISSGSHDDR